MKSNNGSTTILPSFILGVFLIIISVILLSLLINNVWVVPRSHPKFIDFQYTVVDGTATSITLIQAADWRLISLFLFGIGTLITGITLPFVYLINQRLKNSGRIEEWQPTFYILLRQACWIGSWIAGCLWLYIHRTLGLPIAILVLILFLLIEGLLLIRRRTRSDHSSMVMP